MAASSTASATAQINARISSSLKASGDAALANAGFTPTQAVRALWELAQAHSSSPEELRQILLPEEAELRKCEKDERRKRLSECASKGPRLVQDAYASLGVSCFGLQDVPYEDIEHLAYEEKFGSADGWL